MKLMGSPATLVGGTPSGEGRPPSPTIRHSTGCREPPQDTGQLRACAGEPASPARRRRGGHRPCPAQTLARPVNRTCPTTGHEVLPARGRPGEDNGPLSCRQSTSYERSTAAAPPPAFQLPPPHPLS